MPLESTGSMSLGGSVTGRSINLELGRNATATIALGETAIRGLAGVSSGSISVSNFHGKSDVVALDTQTVTNASSSSFRGMYSGGGSTFKGYVSDGTADWATGSNNPIYNIQYRTSSTYQGTNFTFSLGPNATHGTNSGWSTITIGSTTLNRSDAIFFSRYANSYTHWGWYINSNPFGTTTGTQHTVVFT